MSWRAARSLLVLQRQLQAGAPRARPPATGVDEWGLIGDAAHDPTSDHTPHNFPGWGSLIVTAADFPNRPDLGLDAHQVLDDIRRARDARVRYAISNGQMYSSYTAHGYGAWTWRPYTGTSDKHFTHGHLSVVGDARADDESPWPTIGRPTAAGTIQEDDMGASFGPIDIQVDGITSLTLPPVRKGLADPRPAWLNLRNDTNGEPYALRVYYAAGADDDETFTAFPGLVGGFLTLQSGQRWSGELPAGTSCLSIIRFSTHAAAGGPPYRGHLTCCIERGDVVPPVTH